MAIHQLDVSKNKKVTKKARESKSFGRRKRKKVSVCSWAKIFPNKKNKGQLSI